MKLFFNYFFLIMTITFGANQKIFSRSFLSKVTSALNNFNKKNREEVKEVLDNFYTVEPGALYRSQQLFSSTLAYYLKKYNIKTVINLRGDEHSQELLDEKRVVEAHGALFFSLFFSAIYLDTRENLIALLTLYDEAPRPILVHCVGGMDRTGEAAALWVLEIQKKSKQEALEQLSIKYGHRKYVNSAKDFLITIWQGREWLASTYRPEDYPKYTAKK